MTRFLVLALLLGLPVDEWSKRSKAIQTALKGTDGKAWVDALRELRRFDNAESASLLTRTWVDGEKRHAGPPMAPTIGWKGSIALGIGSYTDAGAIKHLLWQMRDSGCESLRELIASAAWRYGKASVDGIKLALKQEKAPGVLRPLLQSGEVLGMTDEVVPLIRHPYRKVRAVAIGIASRLDVTAAVPNLIAELEVDGLLKNEIHAALVTLTGLDLGRGVAEWKRWWEKHGGRFLEFGKESEERRDVRPTRETGAAFYGIPVDSRRAIFIVDCSSSMQGDKWKTAVHELKEVLSRMPVGARFGLIAFNAEVIPLRAGMVEVTGDNVVAAGQFLDAIKPDGGTDIYGAFVDALDMAAPVNGRQIADTIYFVSDGRPNLMTTDRVRGKIREKNPDINVVIHTIAVGGDADREFLKTVAAENDGSFFER